MDIDSVLNLLNAALSAGMSGLCSWAILTHRVRDGVVIKLGLILMAIGSGVTAHDLLDGLNCGAMLSINRARLLTQAGLLVAASGIWAQRMAGRTLCNLVDLSRRDGVSTAP